ncbi:metabotropic glutamate receptor-like isoform X1 [Mytilus californianus]|uniref:metabotropic glutamate receptor-like isoform X1 n=1 Tax=Mytilus californianus TaxID=6549 RepID=UPI0022469F79|nr:metabotropic glutamate receptor-like isoform X1 [Mytilus californianus]
MATSFIVQRSGREHWKLIQITVFFNCICILHGTAVTQSVRSATIPGRFLFGGLFPVHQKGVDGTCGAINPDRGIQRLEAMLFTLDEINLDQNILPGIRIGTEIFDTCARETIALDRSLEFIRGTFTSLDASDFRCEDGSLAKANKTPKAIAGVIGGSYSSVSEQVANLLRLFKIPQISYASTSARLSDKKRYDYFIRTVPPDNFQAKAMVDIVSKFNWTYVSTVASEGEYGVSGIEAFVEEANARNICISESIKINSNANKNSYIEAVQKLAASPENAKVIILFLRQEDAKGILRAVHEKNMYGRFYWIAADGWGQQTAAVADHERAAEGALTLELQSTFLPEFDKYFFKLNPQDNKRNPWFREYWAKVHKCSWPNVTHPITNPLAKFCTGKEQLSLSVYKQESKVQFIYNAVYALAIALHNMYADVCGNRTEKAELCAEMTKLNGETLLKLYLLNTSFIDKYGALVKFNEKGDALGRYNIMNYQLNRNTRLYEYVLVGNWSTSLELETEKIVWAGGTKDIPSSRCSRPCEYDEYKHVGKNGNSNQCCWMCIKCKEYQYLKDEFTCKECGYGEWPDLDKKGCHSLAEKYMQWNTIYAIIPIVLACVGLFSTCTVIVTFFNFRDTPIVMASGRELSYMLLSGCILCYLITFVLIAKPSTFICGIQRFGVGFGFSVMYSSLLTKTNRISRIFDSARRSARRPPFISPKSQIVIASILIFIQVLFTAIWLVLERPGTRLYTPNERRDEVILKCRTDDISFLMSLVYNMLLIIICTYFAIKTRKIPENFNESKFIGFAMYTTCIIWLAFIPIYFGTLNSFQIQITTLSVSISLSATVILVCLFTPKMYIIVFHPAKNVRKLTMNSTSTKKPQLTTSSVLNSNNYDGSAGERIKLSVNYDERFGVTTTEKEGETENLDML